MTLRWGNNHGSIENINGKWYVFYHRQTGTNEFARQGMAEPIDAALDRDGRLYIGDIAYEDGEPVSSRPVEMTSSGMCAEGIDAYGIISAGYACHIHGDDGKAYIKAVYDKIDSVSAPVTNITGSVTVGFRYLQFGNTPPRHVIAEVITDGVASVNVRLDDHRGRIISSLRFGREETVKIAPLVTGVVGRHAVYFEFSVKGGASAEFVRFTFDRERDEDGFISNSRMPHGIGGEFFIEKMNRGGHAELAEWGLSSLFLSPDAKALDIGCGGGANVARLLEKCPAGKVTGVDYSPLCVEKSSEYNRDAIAEGKCRILCEDVRALSFKSGSFDVITAFETIYFWDIGRGFSEVYRVLKSGGRFFICNDTDGESLADYRLEKRVQGLRIYPPENIEAQLKKAGFKSVMIRRGSGQMISFEALK